MLDPILLGDRDRGVGAGGPYDTTPSNMWCVYLMNLKLSLDY